MSPHGRNVQEQLAPYLLFARQSAIQNPRWRICYTHSIHLIEHDQLILETRSKKITLSRGNMIFVPADHWHKINVNPDHPAVFKSIYFDFVYTPRPKFKSRRFYFHLEGDPYFPDDLSPPPPVPITEIADVHHLSHWQALISPFMDFDIHEETDSFEILRKQAYFLLFLRHYLQHVVTAPEIADPRITKVINRLENETDAADHALDQWIRQAGISHRHFYNLFKQQTGTTPIQYWNQLRIQRAKSDLKGTAMSVSDIAMKYHFSSVHYFSRLFHHLNGVSPSEYRKGQKL